MDPFVFHNPTRIVFGPGVLRKFKKEFLRTGIKKPLLVIGKGNVKNYGYLEKLIRQLKEIQINYFIYEGIRVNPTTDQVDTGTEKALKNSCDGVIALGGGSVMDAAKIMALLAAEGGKASEYTGTFKQKGKVFKSALPIITIPTVAATGSEADPIAVISNPDTRIKSSISGFPLYPMISVIDPELTLTCPLNVSINGFIDIICHAIETYFSTDKNTPIQDGITEVVVRTVAYNGKKIIDNPKDLEARTQVSWASTLTMLGFLSGRNGGWPMHAIEHQISGFYPEISHGAGLSAIFLSVIEWGAKKYGLKKLKNFIKNIFKKEIGTFQDGIIFLTDLLKDLKAFTSLKKIGINKKDLPHIAEAVMQVKGNKDSKLTNIVPMTEQDVLKILEESFYG